MILDVKDTQGRGGEKIYHCRILRRKRRDL